MTARADLHLRPATTGDVAVIVDFNSRLARETEGKTLDVELLGKGVRSLLADERRGRYFVALAGAEIVGQIMFTTEWSDWRNGEIWWIQSVYVRADMRHCGVYRAMHEHVRALAKSTPGVAGLRLYVEENNRAAQAVYSKVGMQREGYLVLAELWPAADHP